ncbi:hypothetical protein GGTG_01938 [Gaeumannomyces tritici R3-111a-1]|uniref:Uncharacterized protein n=1 Tax=Gaeumannomyces tritici (strain R3-111a-1) TaxID=644352 RepID=J3NKZ7_GAET3|nr:hypothetical protein GGTG_01938 [Gaeumannomyces tritici R3-111a-1]EJT81964.1 hypothetical protein GGTG_01938 [Gaeumannomyces tritici R3-111a-1]
MRDIEGSIPEDSFRNTYKGNMPHGTNESFSVAIPLKSSFDRGQSGGHDVVFEDFDVTTLTKPAAYAYIYSSLRRIYRAKVCDPWDLYIRSAY